MSKTSVEKITRGWYRKKTLAWAWAWACAWSWSLLALRQAFPEVEVKAKDPVAFCKGKHFWKGIWKTLRGIKKWEEGLYLLAEVDLQEMLQLWYIHSMIKILSIFRSALLIGMSFCSITFFLLFISYVARLSGGLLHMCFTVGDLIVMLRVFLVFKLVASFCITLVVLSITLFASDHGCNNNHDFKSQEASWCIIHLCTTVPSHCSLHILNAATLTKQNRCFCWECGAGHSNQARCWMCYLKPSGIPCFHCPVRLMLAEDASGWTQL